MRTFSIDAAIIPRVETLEHNPTVAFRPYWFGGVPALANIHQRHWLSRPGALTAGLRKLGTLDLTVMRQTRAQATADERVAMGLSNQRVVRIREICMSLNGVPCVVARSALTDQAWSGSWQAVRRLGRRPLADLLYHDRKVSRTKFQIARIQQPHPLGRLAQVCSVDSHRLLPGEAFWARQSVFWRNGKALLVAECFLPAFWQFAMPKDSQVVNMRT